MENEKLVVIEQLSELKELAKYLEGFDYVAYDTETTGLGKDAEIIGYSVACEGDLGFYVVLSYWDVASQSLVYHPKEFRDEAISIIKSLLTKQLVMHNAVFDVDKTMANFGIDLMPALHTDTMVLAHLMDENERVGLKDLGARFFGQDAKLEQTEMIESITTNGGLATKEFFELFKADKNKIGKYAAKDAVLTINIFNHLIPGLFEEKLDVFFYDEECMPLLKGPTYELNTVGVKIDVEKLTALRTSLEHETVQLEAEILEEIRPYVEEKYPGKTEKDCFNITSVQQVSWLLFIRLKENFMSLTASGKQFAKDNIGRLPYTPTQKYQFIEACKRKGKAPEKFMQVDVKTLDTYKVKYPWVNKLLRLKKANKILGTYCIGILDKLRYGVLQPSFLQTGTTGTRYSSRNPNCQNIPRDDKRIKECFIARPGKVFVGADYSQLEPRVFASVSKDLILLEAFKNKEDFYSAISIPVFGKEECSADKNAPNFLGKIHPEIRQLGKVAALSIAYGTGAFKLSQSMNLPVHVCEKIIEDYYERLQGVGAMVRDTHKEVVANGKVSNIFGRPRRIPQAKIIAKFGNQRSEDLKYEYRTMLNLAVNFKIQGTAGSIMNRVAIAFYKAVRKLNLDAKLVLQIHDEFVIECKEEQAQQVSSLLKDCMENTVKLEGIDLIAEPKIAKTLAELK